MWWVVTKTTLGDTVIYTVYMLIPTGLTVKRHYTGDCQPQVVSLWLGWLEQLLLHRHVRIVWTPVLHGTILLIGGLIGGLHLCPCTRCTVMMRRKSSPVLPAVRKVSVCVCVCVCLHLWYPLWQLVYKAWLASRSCLMSLAVIQQVELLVGESSLK